MINENYGQRGPKSKAPGGYGNLTKKGYRRMWDNKQKRWRMEHVLVWEKNKGEIPEGMQIHHKDENRLNNNIENLELIDTLTHKRIHSGCVKKEGQWYKPCGMCKEIKPTTEYYQNRKWIDSECKKCRIKRSTMDKQKRKIQKVNEFIQPGV